MDVLKTLCVLVIAFYTASADFSISKPPTSITTTAGLGNSVVLWCNITKTVDTAIYTVSWFFNGTTHNDRVASFDVVNKQGNVIKNEWYDGSQNNSPKKPKFPIGVPPAGLESTEIGIGLDLEPPRPRHEGVYRCSAMGTGGISRLSDTTNLIINVKPGTPIFTVVRDEQDQDMYDLKCEVKGGKPKPQVMFTRDGIELKVPGDNVTTTVTNRDFGTVDVTINLRVKVLDSDTQKPFQCEAKHVTGDQRSDARNLPFKDDVTTPKPGGSGNKGNQTDPAASTDDGTNVGAIVGGVIGGLLCVAIIIGVVIFVMRRKKDREAEKANMGTANQGMQQPEDVEKAPPIDTELPESEQKPKSDSAV